MREWGGAVVDTEAGAGRAFRRPGHVIDRAGGPPTASEHDCNQTRSGVRYSRTSRHLHDADWCASIFPKQRPSVEESVDAL
jgi:hypothetical protein